MSAVAVLSGAAMTFVGLLFGMVVNHEFSTPVVIGARAVAAVGFGLMIWGLGGSP